MSKIFDFGKTGVITVDGVQKSFRLAERKQLRAPAASVLTPSARTGKPLLPKVKAPVRSPTVTATIAGGREI